MSSRDEDRLLSKLTVFYDLARNLADLSRCRRLQVGCVVITPDMTEVVAIGYNGPSCGRPNDSCRGGEGACGCVHSEANALVKLRTDREDLVMVTTHSPCEHCAGLVVNSQRVGSVVYDVAYRDTTGLTVLRDAGLAVVRLSPRSDEDLPAPERSS